METKNNNKLQQLITYLKGVDNLFFKVVFTIIAIALILICIGIFDMVDQLKEIDSSIYYVGRNI